MSSGCLLWIEIFEDISQFYEPRNYLVNGSTYVRKACFILHSGQVWESHREIYTPSLLFCHPLIGYFRVVDTIEWYNHQWYYHLFLKYDLSTATSIGVSPVHRSSSLFGILSRQITSMTCRRQVLSKIWNLQVTKRGHYRGTISTWYWCKDI